MCVHSCESRITTHESRVTAHEQFVYGNGDRGPKVGGSSLALLPQFREEGAVHVFVIDGPGAGENDDDDDDNSGRGGGDDD